MSEKLGEIDRLKDNFEQMVLEFSARIKSENEGRKDESNTGLAAHELPFHGLLAKAVSSSEVSAGSSLVDLTRTLVAHLFPYRVTSNRPEVVRFAAGRCLGRTSEVS